MSSESNWRQLPKEILANIFGRLSLRRHQAAFIQTCPEWDDAADSPIFWRHIRLKVDEECFEPNLVFLTQKYMKYMKTLEIGWFNHYVQYSKYTYARNHEMLKRVGRFLVLLSERYIQLEHITINNWHNIFHLQKLSYLLMRLIKRQLHLKSITIINANFYETNITSLMYGCTSSRHYLTKLHLHYSTFKSKKAFDGWMFVDILRLFCNLEEITMDYWIFSLMINKLHCNISNIKEITVTIDNSYKKMGGIHELKLGDNFLNYLPIAVVHFKIDAPLAHEQINHIIANYYPVVSFSWSNTAGGMEVYYNCLHRLANTYTTTLRSVNLKTPIEEQEISDDIRWLTEKCKNIESIIFNNVEIIDKYVSPLARRKKQLK